MGIRRGEDWGTTAPLPPDAPVLDTDAALAAVLTVAASADPGPCARPAPSPGPQGPVGLVGGDLCRTLGGTGDRARLAGPEVAQVPVDALVVTLDDGSEVWAVAHVVARGRWWRGHVVAVMNAAWMGEWNVAPAAHPGDGRADVLEGSLPWRQRLAARRRLRSGTHVPHPRITVRKRRDGQADLGRRVGVWADGRRVGATRMLRYRVLADACVVAV